MIARVRKRLRDDAEDGITLVEVIVAMMVFALVSTGFVYTMLNVLAMSRDARAREVAANLAAEQIDLARDSDDLFALLDHEDEIPLNSDVFHVKRTTSWVTDPNEEFSCGGAGGIGAGAGSQLRYKRVSVRVTWDNMRDGTDPVQADTVINPDTRLNDPTLGTIIVSVLNGSGTGTKGVAVTAPGAGSVINPTDDQGCTYVLKVPPKSYDVGLQLKDYVDTEQRSNPTQSVKVVAGQSTTVGFQYDKAATFTAKLASTAMPGVVPKVPQDLSTTFVNTYGSFTRTPDGGAKTPSQSFKLHPFASGYQAYAGACVAGDPLAWPEQEVPGGVLRADRQPAAAAPAGGAAEIPVPMALVQINGNAGGAFLKAVSDKPVAGGAKACAAPETLTFGDVLTSGTTVIALPYGTWTLYSGSKSTTVTTGVAANRISFPAMTAPITSSVAPGTNVLTLDPRVVVAP
jgi:type II secretory pathway pseudopilin PulG